MSDDDGPDVDMNDETPLPLEWRELLASGFADAERRGLGTLHVGFTAAPGEKDRAADFLGERLTYLSDLWAEGVDITSVPTDLGDG